MNIAQHVEHGRSAFPDRPAIVFEGRSYGYAELDERASRAAAGLARLGAGRGDRVALLLPNVPEWAFFYLGAQKLGAVAVSVNPALAPGEVRFVVEDSGAAVVVTTAESFAPLSAEEALGSARWVLVDGEAEGALSADALTAGAPAEYAAVDLEPRAPAAIVYTSGTTGTPKGAALSHGNVVANARAKRRYLGIEPDDRLLLFLPLFHCFGQNAIFNAALESGATVLLHRRFAAGPVLDAVARDGATMFFGVPPTFLVLLDAAAPESLAPVRYFFSAAASLPPEIERRWLDRFGTVIYQGYGLTETSPFASYNHLDRHKPGSIGTPIDGVEMKVVDTETGAELGPGEVGEIVIRGHNVMLGYWNRPEETARAVRDGWFHTGDLGRTDEDGYFFLEDRLKDMINVGGLKVYPAEVENALYRHPAVAEAAVFGVADPLLGERVCARVVARPGHEVRGDELSAFCRERLADYKVPRLVELAEALPKTPSGKVLKRALRHEAAARAPEAEAPAGPRSADEIASWLCAWTARELGADPSAVRDGRSFFDHGLSSLAVVKLSQDLGAWLGRPVAATVAFNFSTIDALARHLAGAAPAAEAPNGAPVDDLGALSVDDLADLLRAEIDSARGRGAK